jgi:hypothetical protein
MIYILELIGVFTVSFAAAVFVGRVIGALEDRGWFPP